MRIQIKQRSAFYYFAGQKLEPRTAIIGLTNVALCWLRLTARLVAAVRGIAEMMTEPRLVVVRTLTRVAVEVAAVPAVSMAAIVAVAVSVVARIRVAVGV